MIRRYTDGFDDWFNWLDRDWFRRIQTCGQWVDTDRYDIVEKPEYRKQLTEQKDKELKELDSYYERRKKELLAERDRLLGLNSG